MPTRSIRKNRLRPGRQALPGDASLQLRYRRYVRAVVLPRGRTSGVNFTPSGIVIQATFAGYWFHTQRARGGCHTAGPIERVWAYLTESEKRGKWFVSVPMELSARGRVEPHFRHANLTPSRRRIRYKQYEEGYTNWPRTGTQSMRRARLSRDEGDGRDPR
jgi:hypothetical protein